MRTAFTSAPWSTALLLVSAGCAGPPATEQTDSAGDGDWISAVERSLLPPVVLEGAELQGWSLEERMAHYDVPAVSVAVIEDGEIAWAKAWGTADTETGRPATVRLSSRQARSRRWVRWLPSRSSKRGVSHSTIRSTSTSPPGLYPTMNSRTAVTLRGLLTTTVWGFPGYRKDEPFRPGAVLATNSEVLDGEGNTDPVRVNDNGTLYGIN